jgi:hypothetical protein
VLCRDAIDGAAGDTRKRDRVLKGSDHHGEARGRGQKPLERYVKTIVKM